MADPIKVFTSKAPTYMGLFMNDFDADKLDAAAVFGNFGHESRGFTALQEEKPIVPGSAGGRGWAMWTGARRRAFEAYCKRNGYDPDSDMANYKWLWNELKGSEKGALPKLKAAKTLKDKVIAFELAFERAHKNYKHYDSRLEWAERALAAYEAAVDTPDLPPTEPERSPEEVLKDVPEDPVVVALVDALKKRTGARGVLLEN